MTNANAKKPTNKSLAHHLFSLAVGIGLLVFAYYIWVPTKYVLEYDRIPAEGVAFSIIERDLFFGSTTRFSRATDWVWFSFSRSDNSFRTAGSSQEKTGPWRYTAGLRSEARGEEWSEVIREDDFFRLKKLTRRFLADSNQLKLEAKVYSERSWKGLGTVGIGALFALFGPLASLFRGRFVIEKPEPPRYRKSSRQREAPKQADRIGLCPACYDTKLDESGCPDCKGHLWRSNEVQDFATTRLGFDSVQLLRDFAQQFGGGRRACPECGRKMREVSLKGVAVDFCMGCGALWLDAEEEVKIKERAEG